MKRKVLTMLMLLALPLYMVAQEVEVTVTLTEAGTLQESLSEYDNIDKLTVKGKFNSIDQKYLREATGRIANLVYLNLTDVELVDSDEEYYSWAEFGGAIGRYGPYHHYILSPTAYTTSEVKGSFNSRATHYYHHTPNFDYGFAGNIGSGYTYLDGNSTLKEVLLPKVSTGVGEGTFRLCGALEKVVLPEGCKTIGEYAFYHCYALKTLENTNKVESIGYNAFRYDGNLKATFAQLSYVGPNAFEYSSIEAISFASGIKEIPECAFNGCTKLTNVTISGTIETIGKSAFNSCTSLTSLEIPGNVDRIGPYAFNECTGLKSIVVGEGTRYIDSHCFYNCGNVETISLPSTIIGVGEDALTGVPMDFYTKDGVQYVGKVAYKLIDNALTDVVILEGTITIADGFARYNSSMASLSLPSTLKCIGKLAFGWTSKPSFKSVVLPEGLEEISESAFSSAKFSNITIPSTVKTIGGSAFEYCEALVCVNWNAVDCQLTECMSPFKDCTGIEVVNIGEGVKKIPAGCFDNLKNLLKVTISSTVEEIGQTGTYYSPRSDMDFNYCGAFSSCPKLKTVTFAENSHLKLIGTGAFQYCTALKEIIIPASVELIAKSAFEGDYNDGSALEKVTFANGSKLKKISSQAFAHCNSLTFIELPEGLTALGEDTDDYDYGVFADCTSLTTIKLPKSLTTIGNVNGSSTTEGSFFNCTALTSIELPGNLQTLGAYTFYGCRALKSIELPANIQEIGNYAFQECTKLSTIVSYIMDPFEVSAFYDCHATLFVPSGTKALYEALNDWKSLTIKETIAGDLNGDEEVNLDDVDPAVNLIMTGSFEGINKAAADMNGSTQVNAADLVLLINKINAQPLLGETAFYLIGDHNSWDMTNKTYAFTKLADGKTWEITIPSEGAGCIKIAPGSAYDHQDGTFWSYLLCAESDQHTGLHGIMQQGDIMAAWLLNTEGATSYTIRIVPSEMTYKIIPN